MRHNASTLAEYGSPGEQRPHPVPDRLSQNNAHRLPGGGRSRLSSRLPRANQRVRSARFTAETTARSEAVVMEVAMPTPQVTLSPMAHST
ncbi:Uncharacterised protein [Nocardia africana]|uniref:Uncharacterized protein n=1 Tax=Nocardia africana TaxID=134964 RepID=A0A378WJ72_9NOCA|nr:Uncharacterised protein [Nocardia africana]